MILLLNGFHAFNVLYAQEVEEANVEEQKKQNTQDIVKNLAINFIVPEISYEAKIAPKYWTNGIFNELGISQLSLTNWAQGGVGSISMNGYLNMHANYKKGNLFWENRAEVDFGFVQAFNDVFKKSKDRITFQSKWGYRTIKNYYFSALLNFKTQISNNYTYATDGTKTLVSTFMSPGELTLGVGMDYKHKESFSLNVAPITGKLTIVTSKELRERYGNKVDEMVRKELGAQIKMEYKKKLHKTVSLNTALTLFSDYIHNPENIRVDWVNTIAFAINKYFNATLKTYLIYDDKIKIPDKEGKNPVARIQFQESLSVTFSYTIGNYQKPK